ncbi:MAG: hypothetical protein RLZZ455_448 [Candidatus Parcubacteria bacterium]
MRVPISRRLLLLIVLIILVLAVPLTLYLVSQQQDIRQKAAGNADLVVSSLQLTDAGGNVRTVFGINEDIYVRITLKNKGTEKGISTDAHTYTQFYSDEDNAVAPGTPSDVQISLRNGEFSAGFEKTYESRWNGLNDSFYQDKIYFNKSTGGTYTARAYINHDGKVQESDIQNNQLSLSYTVTGQYISKGIYLDGDVSSNPPAGFPPSGGCGEQGTNNGVTACYGLGPVNGKGVVKLTNTTSSPKAVAVALYKAYYDFPNPYPTCSQTSCPEQYIWAWTQTIYSAQKFTLDAGATRYVSLPAPSCNWQIDATIGPIILSFHPGQTYGGTGVLIGGGWLEQYNGIQACTPVIPSPTPTSTLTPTLPPDVPTPTLTLTPTPTDIPPSETPTPTVPFCPVPVQVQNVRIECPFCSQ